MSQLLNIRLFIAMASSVLLPTALSAPSYGLNMIEAASSTEDILQNSTIHGDTAPLSLPHIRRFENLILTGHEMVQQRSPNWLPSQIEVELRPPFTTSRTRIDMTTIKRLTMTYRGDDPSSTRDIRKNFQSDSPWRFKSHIPDPADSDQRFDLTFSSRMTLQGAFSIADREQYVPHFQGCTIKRRETDNLPHFDFYYIDSMANREYICTVNIEPRGRAKCVTERFLGAVDREHSIWANSTRLIDIS